MSTSTAARSALSGVDPSAADGAELAALLAQLATADVCLSVEGGRLGYDAPEGAMSLELRRRILAHKGALVRLLSEAPDAQAARVRAGLPDGSRLGCNQGPAHYSAWRYTSELGRYVCRACDPLTYTAQFPAQLANAADAASSASASSASASVPSASVPGQQQRQQRQQLAAALLAWGAAGDFPAVPLAWAQGASSGRPAPYKTLSVGRVAWERFTASAGAADMAAACRAAGLSAQLAQLAASPDAGAGAMTGAARELALAPAPDARPDAPPVPEPEPRDWPEVFAALDTGALWIARADAGRGSAELGGAELGEGEESNGGGASGMVRHELDALSQPEGATARRLVALMEREGVTQLWLHPTWAAAAGLPAAPQSQEDTRDGIPHPFCAAAAGEEWATDASEPGMWGMEKAGRLRPWLKFYRRGQAGTIALSLPQLDPRVAWRRAPDAHTLLAAVLAYRGAMRGYAYRSGPGATGTALIRVLHRGNRTALDMSASLAPADFPEPARTPGLTPQLAWIRALTPDERERGRYIHGYDKNAMFLAACSSLHVGFGAPAHLTAAADPAELAAAVQALTSDARPIRRPVGYWLARVTFTDGATPAAVAAGLLPHPCYASPREPDPAAGWRWYHTATLALAGELGAALDVQEAYVWTETHEPLEPWYQRLRDARAQLTTAAEGSPATSAAALALAAVKATYTQGIGWLDAGWRRTSSEPEDLYRPDWRHAAIATANANLWRNLAKVYHETGRAPFAISTDAAYFMADTPDPVAAAPTPALRLGAGLGQYKAKPPVLPAEQLAPAWALMDAGREPGRVLGAFARAIDPSTNTNDASATDTSAGGE